MACVEKPQFSVRNNGAFGPRKSAISAIFSSPIQGAGTGFLVGQAFQPDTPDVRLESLTYSKNVRLESCWKAWTTQAEGRTSHLGQKRSDRVVGIDGSDFVTDFPAVPNRRGTELQHA